MTENKIGRKRMLETNRCLAGLAPDMSSNSKAQKLVNFEEERESDQQRLLARLKQIGYGKNTVGYENYIRAVPKSKRQSYKEHPRTPDPEEKQSKRNFEGKVKAWRRALHNFDPSHRQHQEVEGEEKKIEKPVASVLVVSAAVSSGGDNATVAVAQKPASSIYEEDLIYDEMGVHDYVEDGEEPEHDDSDEDVL